MTHQELKKLFQALSELENGASVQRSGVSELTALKWLSLHTRSSIQLRASYSRQMSELEFYKFISAHLDRKIVQNTPPHNDANDLDFFTPSLAPQSSIFQVPGSTNQPLTDPIETVLKPKAEQTSAYEQPTIGEVDPPQHELSKPFVSGQELASSTILTLNSRLKQKPKERKMAQAVARLQGLDPANNHAHFQQFTTWLKGHQAQHIKIVNLNL